MDEHEGTTQLLNKALSDKNREAQGILFERLQHDLHRLAEKLMRGERGDHTWTPSDLMQQLLLKFFQGKPFEIKSRRGFFSVARNAMRQLLIDHARHKRTKKAGAVRKRTLLDERLLQIEANAVQMDALADVLDDLKSVAPRQYDVLTGIILCGLEISAVARLLELSESTAYADFALARGFVHRALRG